MKLSIQNIDENSLLKIIPELDALKTVVENNEWHENDNGYVHSWTVFNNLKKNLQFEFITNDERKKHLNEYLDEKIDTLSRREILLWAGILHDIAKPQTFTNNNGVTSCPNHEAEGASIVKIVFKRLDFPDKETKRLYDIVFNHAVPHGLLRRDKTPEQLAADIIETKTKHNDIFVDLLFLALSDTEGSQLKDKNPEDFKFRTTQYHSILNSH